MQIPVYVWAPEEEGLFKPGRCSRWWLHQSLKTFEKDLAALGTSMVYRRSRESCLSLVQLVQETGAQVGTPHHPDSSRFSCSWHLAGQAQAAERAGVQSEDYVSAI